MAARVEKRPRLTAPCRSRLLGFSGSRADLVRHRDFRHGLSGGRGRTDREPGNGSRPGTRSRSRNDEERLREWDAGTDTRRQDPFLENALPAYPRASLRKQRGKGVPFAADARAGAGTRELRRAHGSCGGERPADPASKQNQQRCSHARSDVPAKARHHYTRNFFPAVASNLTQASTKRLAANARRQLKVAKAETIRSHV